MAKLPQIVVINLVVTGILVLGWAGMLAMPRGWSSKFTLVIGMEFGLYRVEIYHGLASGIASMGMSLIHSDSARALDKIVAGRYSLSDFRADMCAISPQLGPLQAMVGWDICQVFSMVEYASYAMIIFGCFGIISLLVGAYLQQDYFTVKAREKKRTWALISFGLAPMFFFLGLVQYAILTSHLGRFPPQDMTSFGTVYICAAIFTVLSVLPAFLTVKFVSKSYLEVINESLSENKRIWRAQEAEQMINDVEAMQAMQARQAMHASYGSAAGVAAASYGFAPGMGCRPPPIEQTWPAAAPNVANDGMPPTFTGSQGSEPGLQPLF